MDTLEAYKHLVQFPIFSLTTINELGARGPTAYALLQRLVARGAVRQIRRGMYSPVDLVSGRILATPYHIACAAAKDGVVVYQAALAYHGIEPEPVQEYQVACPSRFRAFTYEGLQYKPARSMHHIGVCIQGQIRVTDLERTVLDAIHQPMVFGGLTLLCRCLERITTLKETNVLRYLELSDSPTLYAKCGFFLQRYQGTLGVSQDLLQVLEERKSGQTRFLGSQGDKDCVQITQWNLRVPAWLSHP